MDLKYTPQTGFFQWSHGVNQKMSPLGTFPCALRPQNRWKTPHRGRGKKREGKKRGKKGKFLTDLAIFSVKQGGYRRIFTIFYNVRGGKKGKRGKRREGGGGKEEGKEKQIRGAYFKNFHPLAALFGVPAAPPIEGPGCEALVRAARPLGGGGWAKQLNGCG